MDEPYFGLISTILNQLFFLLIFFHCFPAVFKLFCFYYLVMILYLNRLCFHFYVRHYVERNTLEGVGCAFIKYINEYTKTHIQ